MVSTSAPQTILFIIDKFLSIFLNRDAVYVGFINSFTSIYSGFAIFALLGYMANVMSKTVPDVTDSGEDPYTNFECFNFLAVLIIDSQSHDLKSESL